VNGNRTEFASDPVRCIKKRQTHSSRRFAFELENKRFTVFNTSREFGTLLALENGIGRCYFDITEGQLKDKTTNQGRFHSPQFAAGEYEHRVEE
jgi:hypothetical protein